MHDLLLAIAAVLLVLVFGLAVGVGALIMWLRQEWPETSPPDDDDEDDPLDPRRLARLEEILKPKTGLLTGVDIFYDDKFPGR